MSQTVLSGRQLSTFFVQAVNSQALAASDTYITGSQVSTLNSKIGTRTRWRFSITKTGAGVATPVWSIRVGTAGSTADAAVITFTGSAQTAVIDTAFVEMEVLFRATGTGTSAVVAGCYMLTHNLAITGFSVLAVNVGSAISGGFDSLTGTRKIGVSVNAGASSAWTIIMANTELINYN